MTIDISNNNPRISYSVAQGVTQTSFAVPFEFFDDSDVNVYVDGVLKTITTDYTITGGAGSTGTVNISVTGGSGGSIVVLTRDITIERTTDFTAGADINRAALNTQLDTLTAIAADVKDRATLALSYNDQTVGVPSELPNVETLKGNVLAFNVTTGAPEAGPTIGEVANAQTYANNAAASATNSASSATAAATSATNASTSATNAATSATAAAASEAASAASESAAATSATNAASSASSAASSASAAATSATDAATSEINAAASAAAALVSENNAATSETNAATSATNAATSATNSASSAAAAAASAAAAAATYDTFDDRYLGSKAADPTTDNDGDPLVEGMLYFNSVQNQMRVYDGGSWIAASAAGTASLLKYEYTATASQTTFSGADDNAATLSYVVNNIIVSLNGVILDDVSDYTATDGTSIVLTSGAAAGDLLSVIAFKSFTVADAVPASTGGTFGGNVTAPAFIGDGSQLTGIQAGAGYFQGENGNTGDTTNGKGDIFRTHESTLNTNVTIASGDNSLAAGPLTVASGVTLTVSGNLSIV